MPSKIRFTCSNCSRSFSVDEKYRGKKAKCPCGNQLSIPPDTSSLYKATTNQAYVSKKNTGVDLESCKKSAHDETIPPKTGVDACPFDEDVESPSRRVFWIAAVCLGLFAVSIVSLTILLIQKPTIHTLSYNFSQEIDCGFYFGKFVSSPGDMFLVVQITVPIRPFIVTNISKECDNLANRWMNYMDRRSKTFTHKWEQIKVNPDSWISTVDMIPVEETWPVTPQLSVSPYEGKCIALIDPARFTLKCEGARQKQGCLIAFENWHQLPNNTIWHFYMSTESKTQTLWFDPISKGLQLPWDEVITLYLPNSFDKNSRITLSVGFVIPEQEFTPSLSNSICLNSQNWFMLNSKTKIRQKEVHWKEKLNRWDLPQAYGPDTSSPYYKVSEYPSDVNTVELIMELSDYGLQPAPVSWSISTAKVATPDLNNNDSLRHALYGIK